MKNAFHSLCSGNMLFYVDIFFTPKRLIPKTLFLILLPPVSQTTPPPAPPSAMNVNFANRAFFSFQLMSNYANVPTYV